MNQPTTDAATRARAGHAGRRGAELRRDPALWVWLVVLLLAMLPVKAAIGA